MVNVVKSFDSEMGVTFGCQDLSKHLRILMFNSSLSKILPRSMRWCTMWVNLFCTSEMVSPFNILNISYFSIKACFLALFTFVMPSWVTSRIHLLHWESMKNSSEFKGKVIMFLTMQSYWAFLSFTLSPLRPRFFNKKTLSFSTLGINEPLW